MQDGQLGATAVETNVAGQMRASANLARGQGNASWANQLDSWAAQLEADPTGYQQPFYRPYRPYYPFANYPFSYFNTFFHPIDSFIPFGRNVTITSTSSPGRITNIR